MAQMVAAHGWDTTAAAVATSSSVLEQWPTIAPELVGKVDAVRFDTASHTLHLLPATSAYRTQLTLHQKKIVAKVNAAAGPDTVRHLEILRPPSLAAIRSPDEPAPTEYARAAPRSSTPAVGTEAPKTRETASQGYRRALEAHQAGRKATVVDPAIQAAIERQIREQAREPETLFDGRQAVAELQAKTTGQQARSSDAARTRALQRLATERSGLATITPAAAPRRLRRTA